MAGQRGKRSTTGRAAIVLGLGIASLALLWFLYDLAQIAMPAPDLPEWAQAAAVSPSPTAAAASIDQGMVPVVLPADPTSQPSGAGENTTQPTPLTGIPTQAAPATVEATPTPTPIPTPTKVPDIPVRIVIPSIDLDAPVVPMQPEKLEIDGVEYQQWNAPNEFAAGWHTNSAPLGEVGNTVLNGHHNIDGEVFGSLVDLEDGAMIRVYGEQKTYTYQVTQRMILPERNEPLEVRLANAIWIAPTEDERLTLITCWPANSNTHRLIIVASPVKP